MDSQTPQPKYIPFTPKEINNISLFCGGATISGVGLLGGWLINSYHDRTYPSPPLPSKAEAHQTWGYANLEGIKFLINAYGICFLVSVILGVMVALIVHRIFTRRMSENERQSKPINRWPWKICLLALLLLGIGYGIYRLADVHRIENTFEKQFDTYANISIEKIIVSGSPGTHMEIVDRETLDYFAMCLSQRKANVDRIQQDNAGKSWYCYWAIYVENHPVEMGIYLPDQKVIDHIIIKYPFNRFAEGDFYDIYLPEPRPEGFQEFLKKVATRK